MSESLSSGFRVETGSFQASIPDRCLRVPWNDCESAPFMAAASCLGGCQHCVQIARRFGPSKVCPLLGAVGRSEVYCLRAKRLDGRRLVVRLLPCPHA